MIDWSNGEKDQQIILATLKKMKDYGPDYWTGYTYAWYANMLARAFKGEEAAEALRVFASCFCLKNLSMPMETSLVPVNHCLRIVRLHWKETCLCCSRAGNVVAESYGSGSGIPCYPGRMEDVAFTDLRARGGFLVSAERKGGKVVQVKIVSEREELCISFLLIQERFWR